MTRLIIITAVKFLACRNQIQLVILEFGDLGHQTGNFGPIQFTQIRSHRPNLNKAYRPNAHLSDILIQL